MNDKRYYEPTEAERISRDWERERFEERRERKLDDDWELCDYWDYYQENLVEAPEFLPKKPVTGWTTQMNLFDEEVA